MKIQESIAHGIEFWNDSSDLEYLQEAVNKGAVGATCNPVIVYNAIVRQKEIWSQVLKNFVQENPQASEQDSAWYLVKYAGRKASELLLPVFEKTEGKQGRISLQVNPYFYNSYEAMLQQGIELADLAPNITIKVPATDTGIQVMEGLSSLGISVNATVSFSVAQAIASAEAIERGLNRAQIDGRLKFHHSSYVTIMVGRVEDYIRNEMLKMQASIHPVAPLYAGIAVFKEAFKIFTEQKFKARLLSAAYRHQLHWSELIGEGIVQSIPYEWWKRFDQSSHTVKETLYEPVPSPVLHELYKISSFETLMNASLIKREDFVHMVPSVNTLKQFLGGQDDLIRWVRGQILG